MQYVFLSVSQRVLANSGNKASFRIWQVHMQSTVTIHVKFVSNVYPILVYYYTWYMANVLLIKPPGLELSKILSLIVSQS